MQAIYLTLFFLIFYFLYMAYKSIWTEKLRNQISDSLLIGISEYCFCQISNVRFHCVNKQPPNDKEAVGRLTVSLTEDTVAEKAYYYLYLVHSIERSFFNDEWIKYFEKSNRGLEAMDTSGEAIRQLALIVVLLSLYAEERTRNKAMSMLESMPVRVAQEVKTVINYSQFNEVYNSFLPYDL